MRKRNLLMMMGYGAMGSTLALKPLSSLASIAKSEAKINVAVTFNAMAEFVKAIGRDRVEVTTLIPNGVEPHEYSPKPSDLLSLSRAQMVVANGLGLEPWIFSAVKASGNPRAKLVIASEGYSAIKAKEGTDPHMWLSLSGAEQGLVNITAGLAAIDPKNERFYRANSIDTVQKLGRLYVKYGDKIRKAKSNKLVTGHAAFGYLCRDFGLVQSSVENVYAEGEPTAKQLAQLVQYCRDNKVKVVFAEELASPEISRTLAKEAGARVETIYTMESEEEGLSYLERMERNLQRIADALNQ